jgi:pimeloyl-ACP methyl ester carboxylesterase
MAGGLGTKHRSLQRGTFSNSMEFMRLGSGPKTMLMIQGGPGSGSLNWLMVQGVRPIINPFLEAGYAVWTVSRRRHMPAGYTIADMADDFAGVIRDELGGRVDVVYGEEMGGLITQHLAAVHPQRLGSAVVVAAGWRMSDWGKDVDLRLGRAMAARHRLEAGKVLVEGMLPKRAQRWLGPLLAPLAVSFLPGHKHMPPEDYLTEAQAQEIFDCRALLPSISAPVLLISSDCDPYCPKDVVQQTADQIPDCTLVWYEGSGHLAAVSSRRIPRDVLAFLNRGCRSGSE